MANPYNTSRGCPWGENDPGPHDDDERPRFADATHAHRCVGCGVRVRCYADGCGLALHYQCGQCRAAAVGDAIMTYGDLFAPRQEER